MEFQNQKPTFSGKTNSSSGSASLKVWTSEELFKGSREVLIEHEKAYYRLMITKSGKLILNK